MMSVRTTIAAALLSASSLVTLAPAQNKARARERTWDGESPFYL